jgi:septum formation protein
MLILASGSPRRRELLAQAGYTFRVQPADIPENRHTGEDPIAFVLRLAREKAEAVHAQNEPSGAEPLIVLGADTIVVVGDQILGKPASPGHAAQMLRSLSGRTHRVVTGVCVLSAERIETAAEVTWVAMRTLSDADIAEYVATGEPLDKAGAYAIQGRAASWIPRIQGCYFNVVGLPLALVSAMLEGLPALP